MRHEALVRGLVIELYKMDISELLEFKRNEARKLETLGYSQEICNHVVLIIDVAIQKKEAMSCRK